MYWQRATDFIRRVRDFSDADELTSAFMGEAGLFGIEHISMSGLLARDSIHEGNLLANNWPDEWYTRYKDQRYQLIDPLIDAAFSRTRPFTWAEALAGRALDKRQQRLFGEAGETGIREGIVFPVLGHFGYVALISLTGSKVEISLEDRSALSIVAMHYHDRLRELVGFSADEAGRVADLSPREIEILRWAAAGKSNWEIGQILGISRNTVATHISRAKSKFGVSTRTQTILAAVSSKSIH